MKYPPRPEKVYSAMGEALAGMHLRCEKCGRTEKLKGFRAARYLREGWPRCCSETMKLEKEPPPPAPRKAQQRAPGRPRRKGDHG